MTHCMHVPALHKGDVGLIFWYSWDSAFGDDLAGRLGDAALLQGHACPTSARVNDEEQGADAKSQFEIDNQRTKGLALAPTCAVVTRQTRRPG